MGLELPVSADGGRRESAGLDDALSELYREHFHLVFRGLLRLGVPRSLVEDAVQDVFLVVHRRWNDFAGRSSHKTWIYGIAVRVAKDYRRSESRHANRVRRFAELAPVAAEESPSPSEQSERREANRLLHHLLAGLEEEQREVLVLVELEELDVKAAAEALGIRVRTCQRRLRAGREAFEAALARRRDEIGRSKA